MAAHLASEAALRLVKPGNDNIEVTETLNKVAESFECKVNNLTFILLLQSPLYRVSICQAAYIASSIILEILMVSASLEL